MKAKPGCPLGEAEQYLLALASIPELLARLKLWDFKLSFEATELEIADNLMDLKEAVTELRKSKTLDWILAVVLTIVNFLNGSKADGFSLEFLSHLHDIKDTVHKQSLLYHVVCLVNEQFEESTDLHSELSHVHHSAKVDVDNLNSRLKQVEEDANASWDRLRAIAKHESSNELKLQMADFLADVAERIHVLKVIYRRVNNRFKKFLLYTGMNKDQASKAKIDEVCKLLSDFSLEYRTTREKLIKQQLKRKLQERKGKRITAELPSAEEVTQVNGGAEVAMRRRGRESGSVNEDRRKTPPEDATEDSSADLLSALAGTVIQKAGQHKPRRFKRRKNSNARKSLRRTLHGDKDQDPILLALKTYDEGSAS
jgi:hypothetical protein